jgi:hypothetical protein
VNAILNDPGPLSLKDPEMETRLGLCMLQILQAEMKTQPSGEASSAMTSG